MTSLSNAATGGGLTPDLIARAVIAAAQSYGDDPIGLFSSTAFRGRRALPPAISAIARNTDATVQQVARILGVNYQSVQASQAKKAEAFVKAEAAAARAVTYAGWRPEAAASKVKADLAPAGPIEGKIGTRPDDAAAGAQEAPYFGDVARLPGREPGSLATRLAAMHNAKPAASIAPPATTAPARVQAPAPVAGSLERRILDLLQEGSANTQGMATVLDVKESAVCATLRILLHAGQVVADPVPPEGLRAQRWRLCA